MSRNLVNSMLVAGMVGIFAAQAIAGWEKAGLISASGSGTEEVRIGAGAVNEVRFTCTQGSVTIKSIVVTTGAGEATVDVNESMSQGDTKDVSLRNHLGIRGMKVNHEGSGQYQVDLQ